MLFNRIKISHKLWSIVVTGLLIFSLFGIYSYKNNQQYIKSLHAVYQKELQPLDNLRIIQTEFREIEYQMAGALSDLVSFAGAGEHLKFTTKDINKRWREFEKSFSGLASKEQTKWIKDFEAGLNGFNKNIQPLLLKAYFDEDTDKIEELYERWLDYKPLLIKSIDGLAGTLKKTTEQVYMSQISRSEGASRLTLTLIGLMLLSFVAITFFLIRSINRPLRMVIEAARQISNGDLCRRIDYSGKNEIGEMISNLNSMIEKLTKTFFNISKNIDLLNQQANRINSSAEALSTVAENQSTQSQQVASAANEMTQTAVEMAGNSNTVLEASRNSFEKASKGKAVVKETIKSISIVSEQIKDVTKRIDAFGESSKEIANIVTLIKDIAEQTNLLALNAAIEAARAGEHGKGFAVVAEEVRKLAEKTTRATEEIGQKIKNIQQETEEIVGLMKQNASSVISTANRASQSEEVLDEIVKSSDRVKDLITQVATGIEQQSEASEEITKSIEEINNSILLTSREVDSLNELSKHLLEISKDLSANIEVFKTGKQSSTVTPEETPLVYDKRSNGETQVVHEVV